jgi:hypothetical protein
MRVSMNRYFQYPPVKLLLTVAVPRPRDACIAVTTWKVNGTTTRS